MKKLFFFAMLAVAALAVSCNKDDDTEVSGDLVGVWTMNVESTHYVANLLEWDFYSTAYECIKTKNQ